MCFYLLNECLFSMFIGTMLSFSSSFEETYAMFLEFDEDLNNTVGGLSLVGDNSGESIGTLTHNYLNLFLTLSCCFNLFSRNHSTISDS